jgi:alkyl hydroperoxide reductase subunit AhpC
MPLQLGDPVPDFTATTTQGPIRFHEWMGDGWAVLFSHPKDFTPVCTTELGEVSRLKPEFERRNVKVAGLSVDPIESHTKWAEDIRETQGHALNFPLIADHDRKVADLYGMIHPNANDTLTVRSVFVVGPDRKLKATPVNWKQGENVIISSGLSDDDAKKKFPDGWKAPKPYLRIVPQPGIEVKTGA